MHAFIFEGRNKNLLIQKAKEMAQDNYLFEFSCEKISDVRELLNFLKFSFERKTYIIIKNLENSKEEAMNAFLKTLEEPPRNVIFVIIVPSSNFLPKTIVSRCVIRKFANPIESKDFALNFLNSSDNQKFTLISEIKNKDQAEEFLEKLLASLHTILVEDEGKVKTSLIIKNVHETLSRIKGNANVALNLTNLIVRVSKISGNG